MPPLDGRFTLSGLRAPVDVRFDRFAVPHVVAKSDADAWRTVGYLQGRDRLWQMELYRRAASGRLSELLGSATIPIDQRFIILQLRRAAEVEWQQTTPRVRVAFENFSAGVNAAMDAGWGRLPLEFRLLRFRPEPWTPIDSLAIGKLFAWRLGENHRAELLRYELVQAIGPRALELFPAPPDWAASVLGAPGASGAPGARRLAAVASTRDPRPSTSDHRPLAIDQPWLAFNAGAMSNAWVVHGSRTASGRPILANDPHLAIEMPSVWWEVHVVSDTLNVAGVSIPGIPFVIIGHNARIGWGLTNVGADVQDFQIEELDASRQRYRSGNQWLPLDVRRHEIRVSGRAQPFGFDLRSTSNGPLLNSDEWRDLQPGDPPVAGELADRVLALKWDVIVKGGSAAAFDALGRASTWGEFVDAVRAFSAPAQNFVYADVDGNIGYAMSGLVPVRTSNDGSVPVSGGESEEGQRFVEIGLLPAVLNPPSGQIVTANNEVDRGFPHLLTRDWVAPFRAQRIIDLLGTRRGLDIDAMTTIQRDINSASADWILDNVELPDAVAVLGTWDRRVDERPVVALYEAFEEALWRRTFGDEMPAGLYTQFYRYAGNERFAGLHAVIGTPTSPWFDDRTTTRVETRVDIARMAANDAVWSLRARFGDMGTWRWDVMHAVKFSHPLGGGGRVLDWFFSRGPVPVMGDSMTVNKTTTNLRRPYEANEAASYRQILDVGAWDASIGVNTTGQSGHPRSPHYFDQNELWRQGQYRPLPFTRDAVAAASIGRLELVP